MKIGFSYSRCALDILEERVEIDDVEVIISRTLFDPENDTQWQSIWDGYQILNPVWAHLKPEQEQPMRDLTLFLDKTGRLFQPRKKGARQASRPYHWLELTATEEERNQNELAKRLWEKYQTALGLGNG